MRIVRSQLTPQKAQEGRRNGCWELPQRSGASYPESDIPVSLVANMAKVPDAFVELHLRKSLYLDHEISKRITKAISEIRKALRPPFRTQSIVYRLYNAGYTIKQLGAMAGATPSDMSNYFHGRQDRVSKAKRRKIDLALREIGIKPKLRTREDRNKDLYREFHRAAMAMPGPYEGMPTTAELRAQIMATEIFP